MLISMFIYADQVDLGLCVRRYGDTFYSHKSISDGASDWKIMYV